MQTKKQSMVESVVQQLTGYLVGLGTQYVVFPLYGMEVDLIANLQIGAVFAIVSTIRSYVLRRVFNKQHLTPPDLVKHNISLQRENEDLHILVNDMQKYIKKIDNPQ